MWVDIRLLVVSGCWFVLFVLWVGFGCLTVFVGIEVLLGFLMCFVVLTFVFAVV